MTEIEKLNAGHPDTQSVDIVAGNIEALRALFPEAFTEGKIDFEVLKQCLGGTVEEREEKYGLNWHGKRRARQIALTPSTGTLLPCPEDSVDWDTTQNLMIEGDNLEVLKLLKKSYARKIKLIYIDPPYNTGSDFIYSDKFSDGLETYLEATGQLENGVRRTSNPETSGRYHTAWLSMMYPRLKLARDLLSDEGLIFISIDDHELHNLIQIGDEIFGQENRIEVFCWQKTTTPANLSNSTKKSIEYIVCYARNRTLPLVGASKPSVSTNGLMNQPNAVGTLHFPRGVVRTSLPDGVYAAGKYGTAAYDIQLLADTEVKGGIFVNEVVLSGRFKWAQPYLNEQINSGVKIYIKTKAFSPSYEKEEYDPEKPWNIINKSYDVGTNENASSELDALFSPNFSENIYPKPTSLLKFVISMSVDDGDMILDFFAGSGSFGHAAMLHSVEKGKKVRWALVQLPEEIPEDFNARKAGFKTISALAAERLKRVRVALGARPELDTGFRFFKLAPSNVRAWEPSVADLEGTLLAHAEHLVPGRSEADILTELLLKLGLDLCVPIETKDIAGKSVHSVGAGALIVCLSDGITRETVEGLAKGIIAWWQALAPAGDTRVVFKDSAFADDVAKTNMAAILNQAGIKDMRSL
ncbi:site-specific DNA-methyltransferase [Gemmobacter aquaticus]|nr:site-specific DNA-methyltransferase [Gemmobacter aquaticus]